MADEVGEGLFHGGRHASRGRGVDHLHRFGPVRPTLAIGREERPRPRFDDAAVGVDRVGGGVAFGATSKRTVGIDLQAGDRGHRKVAQEQHRPTSRMRFREGAARKGTARVLLDERIRRVQELGEHGVVAATADEQHGLRIRKCVEWHGCPQFQGTWRAESRERPGYWGPPGRSRGSARRAVQNVFFCEPMSAQTANAELLPEIVAAHRT